jgi:membrane associated rhomboid family serine protease
MRRTNSLFSKAVIWITAVNVTVYLIQQSSLGNLVGNLFSLTPLYVVQYKFIWQIFTYQFLHSPNTFAHIFFNMYLLVMFGLPVEGEMGSRRFLFFYLLCGTGAGLFIFVISLITGGIEYQAQTLGASGAVFGVLVAFAVYFPEAELLLFFVLPVKAKYLVPLYGVFELVMELTGGQANVSHLGHLGGIAFALLYFFINKNFSRKKKFKGSARKGEIRKIYEEVKKIAETNDPALGMKKIILNKLSAGGGVDALTDDEWQFVKQLDILIDDNSIKQSIIVKEDIQTITDAQFITQVRRFISLS